jgi:hypothetical protein
MVNRASAEYNYDSWIVKVLRVRGTGVLKSSAHFTPGYPVRSTILYVYL